MSDQDLESASFRLPTELLAAIDAYAESGHRTRSSAIRELLETALVDLEHTKKIAGALKALRTLHSLASKIKGSD